MDHAGPGSAVAIAAAVRQGSLKAVDALERCLGRIAAHDERLHAFVEVFGDNARAAAAAVDRARAAGATLGPLAGVPVAIKDNLLLEGRRAACGSRMLADFESPCTATVVERLRDLGAVVIGRTNMDEFGMGSSTERSAFGPTRNPWDETRVPGGSSGGAAVAVAADFCPLALGSDTGGSVRQPAALCGITGLKPTYGRLSRFGLVAYASSLDCVGILARSARDIAAVMPVAGKDTADATSASVPVPDYTASLAPAHGLEGLRIGVPKELQAGIDAGVGPAVAAALETIRRIGASLKPWSRSARAEAEEGDRGVV
jgi:aspartyl-tRNA(Asn)/glutamyl-tRNA(Gln) amidotransferase subunit A